MIANNIELDEKFADENYFVLDSGFYVEEYDGDGFCTGKHNWIKEGTEWELDVGDGRIIGGDIRMDGLSTNEWLEISEDTFRKQFTAHKL